MTDTTEKYLTLRGANNDIYFFQKRVSEKVANIIGTRFVKTSLRTKDINEAISSRDELVDALNELEKNNILDISDHFRKTLDSFGISISNELSSLTSVISKLADPNSDSIDEPYKNLNVTRSLSSEYSVLSGVCTHLGCSPKYYPEVEPKPWDSSWEGGFFCPCHGSMFDLVGRVYKGVPAPTNLTVPPHFFEGSILTIGEEA